MVYDVEAVKKLFEGLEVEIADIIAFQETEEYANLPELDKHYIGVQYAQTVALQNTYQLQLERLQAE